MKKSDTNFRNAAWEERRRKVREDRLARFEASCKALNGQGYVCRDCTLPPRRAGMFGILILMANVFIVLIMVWLIHYMVSFMAQQRGKEFGIYMLLGFRKKQIARLFLMENMVLGAAALVIGTVPGIFFQQVLTSAIYGILETE